MPKTCEPEGEREPALLRSGPPNSPLDLSPYRGHWVAVVSGRVVSVGETARQALLAARYQCAKDEPSLIWVT